MAFIGSAALWWVYFHRSSEAASEVFSSSENPGRIARSAYAYFHLPMIAGVIAADAGTLDSIALTLGGAALFLAGHALFKLAVFAVVPFSRLVAIVALAVVPFSRLVAIVALAVLAVWDTVSNQRHEPRKRGAYFWHFQIRAGTVRRSRESKEGRRTRREP